jgi:C4-dicarboxylate-specific signal transduction histidine kinase
MRSVATSWRQLFSPNALGNCVQSTCKVTIIATAISFIQTSQLQAGDFGSAINASAEGFMHWGEVLIWPLLLMEVCFIIALFFADRHRRRLERSLRESDERTAFASEAAHLGFWRINTRTGQTWMSEQARLINNIEPGAEISLSAWLAAIHPDDRAKTRQAIDDAVASGNLFECEQRVQLNDGEVRWVSSRGRSRQVSSSSVELTGIVMDITSRKQMEIRSEQQHQQLAHLARVGIVGDLSGGLAHELNQPLTAILSNAQAAQRMMVRQQSPSDLRETISDIIDDGTRARELIRNVRTLLKKGDAQFGSVDINGVIRRALDLAHSDLVTSGIRLMTSLGTDVPTIRADRIQMEQVVLNLLVNAIEAMSGLDRAHRSLVISTFLDGRVPQAIRIAISDSGAGVPIDAMNELFEPFFTTKEQGLGLGLWLCRSIVLAHGGQLWAVNNPDRGTTFHIALPVAAQAVA